MAAYKDTTVTLRDGRQLACTEWGTSEGPPDVYFHGSKHWAVLTAVAGDPAIA